MSSRADTAEAETAAAALADVALVSEARRLAVPVIDELLREARFRGGLATRYLSDYAESLMQVGIPVERISLHVRQLHPLFAARTLLWLKESRGTVNVDRAHGVQNTDMFLRSPVKPIYEGGQAIRRRLHDADCPFDYPVLEDLKAQGFTDYTIRPLHYTDRRAMAIGLSTKASGGFSDLHVAAIDETLPAFAAVLELHEQRRTARLLLDTYVGPNAGSRVLGGAIRRGYGEIIPAAIWYCDLRGFSELSEALEISEVIGTLNDYFDHIAKPIESHGGEILKFIGDGVLAIFPIEQDRHGAAAAAEKALAAAEMTLKELPALNEARTSRGVPVLRYGISLHIGDVMYGNVGSETRLDFTVIGREVNLTCRLETLARDIEPPLILSADFAARLERNVRSLGSFRLKGIAAPQEAFTLAECRLTKARFSASEEEVTGIG